MRHGEPRERVPPRTTARGAITALARDDTAGAHDSAVPACPSRPPGVREAVTEIETRWMPIAPTEDPVSLPCVAGPDSTTAVPVRDRRPLGPSCLVLTYCLSVMSEHADRPWSVRMRARGVGDVLGGDVAPAPSPTGAMGLLARARADLDRPTPQEAWEEQSLGAVIVDVRTGAQRSSATGIPGALVIDLTVLPGGLDPSFDHRIPEARSWDTRYVLMCRHGYSSLMCRHGYCSSLAAWNLRQMGLLRATDVIGG